MADLTIVYWRDIPAQVIAKAGRRSAKAELPRRFMEAIDAAAMHVGAIGTDDYLAGWRRGEAMPCADDLDAAVAETVAAIDKAYDTAHIRILIERGGNEDASAR